MITFLNELLIFGVTVMDSFNLFFGLGVRTVQIVVESEELDDTGDIDDGYKYP